MPDRAARYTQEFTEADIAAIVEDGRSLLRVVRNGRLVHETTRMSWEEAQAYYRRGHTLLVRYTERSSAKVEAWLRPSRSFFTHQWISKSI